MNLLEQPSIVLRPRGMAVSWSLRSCQKSGCNGGDPIGFTITVSNIGPGVGKDVTLTDTLPNSGLTWMETPDNPDCMITAGVLTCNFGNLAPGATETVHITSTARFDRCGAIVNTAQHRPAMNDPATWTTIPRPRRSLSVVRRSW